MKINDFERVDSLNGGYRIIQDTRGFLYGTDAVILSEKIKLKKGEKLLDLCSGSGIIPILCAIRFPDVKISGVEYFASLTDMAKRSAEMNGFSDKITFINADILNIDKLFLAESFDAVSINPPYRIGNSGIQNENEMKKAARHEILCTLDGCVASAAYALKYGGRFYMVHRADRLADVICSMRKYKIEPKELTFAFGDVKSRPKLIVIEGKKGAGSELKINPPLILRKE